jgi:hypothetical protein
MSHVDEGLLHAYLDGALLEGDAERVHLEAHLALCADCRVRMDDARRVKEHAHAALGQLAPARIQPPAWDQIVATHAGRTVQGGGGKARGRQPFIPLAWAASLVLAVGAGWMASELTTNDAARSVATAPALDDAKSKSAAEPVVAAPEAASEDVGLRESRGARGALDAVGRSAERNEYALQAERDRNIQGRTAADAAAPPATVAPDRRDIPAAARAANLPALLEKEQTTVSAVFADSTAVQQLRGYAARSETTDTAGHMMEPLFRDYALASTTGQWRTIGNAEATTRLGRAPFTIPGTAADSVQLAEIDGRPLIRSLHRLADGTPVELVQRVQPLALQQVGGARLESVRSAPQQQALQGQLQFRRQDSQSAAADLFATTFPNVQTFARRTVASVPVTGFQVLLVTTAPPERVATLVGTIR